MIIGHGTIASVIQDRDGLLFFASGVANSQETDENQYKREEDLLLAQDKSKHIVYFGSLSIFYNSTRYTQHKRRMEALVKKNFERYTIMRLGNPDWGNNPIHLIPFIKNKIKNNEPFEIWDAYRYVLEKEEFVYWLNLIPEWSCEMNVVGTRMLVKDIVKKYGHK